MNNILETVELLKSKGLTVGFAESLTGGLISSSIVNVPGASAVFKGSIVSYTNSVKIGVLGVEEAVIASHTEVSEECAMQMASGARKVLGTDLAVSVTGIAGPDGDLPGKPVGTVYMGVAFGDTVKGMRFNFSGDRQSVRQQTADMAFRIILELLGAQDG
ncbi:MAG: CinA family protein [Saccharofermentans sp.]|nr:CinA family protein [Saccharofermentans sp.]